MKLNALLTNSALAGGIGLVLANRLLLRAGLRRRADGWRRGAGLVLRNETATFILSAFGLNIWSDTTVSTSTSIDNAQQHASERLAKFLAGQTLAHICVKRSEDEDCAAVFEGPSYTLGFEDWIDGPARFVRPAKWEGTYRSPGIDNAIDPLFNIIFRLDPRGKSADAWIRVNHIGLDGVPSQEIMLALEKEWGVLEQATFPTPEEFTPHAGPRPSPGRPETIEMQAFVDFQPLLQWRKEVNARLPEPITLSAAIPWCLSQHEAFAKTSAGTTVELPAMHGLGRGVGVVVARPLDYPRTIEGLTRYVRDFNRELNLTRQRASSGCLTLDAAANLPPKLATTLLRYALNGNRAFGSMGLSLIRDAKVFGAPLGDYGHPDGFIAIGSVALPTGSGRKVGCVCIKGPASRIANYPRAIQEAISKRPMP